MSKTTTLNLRVDPQVKKDAEEVLSRLGISMSTAIDIYLRQISLTGGIPFTIHLPKGPDSIDADLMNEKEIMGKIEEGIRDIKEGNYQEASEFFKEFYESIKNGKI